MIKKYKITNRNGFDMLNVKMMHWALKDDDKIRQIEHPGNSSWDGAKEYMKSLGLLNEDDVG